MNYEMLYLRRLGPISPNPISPNPNPNPNYPNPNPNPDCHL